MGLCAALALIPGLFCQQPALLLQCPSNFINKPSILSGLWKVADFFREAPWQKRLKWAYLRGRLLGWITCKAALTPVATAVASFGWGHCRGFREAHRERMWSGALSDNKSSEDIEWAENSRTYYIVLRKEGTSKGWKRKCCLELGFSSKSFWKL